MKERIEGMKQAKRIVEKLAVQLVGHVDKCGRRDQLIYEQGVGCEKACKIIEQAITLMEKEDDRVLRRAVAVLEKEGEGT